MPPSRLHTALNETLGITHPLLSAPMAGIAGGRLAAAVSRAGGLGLIGGGYCDPEWIGGELAAAGDAPVGIGFIGWRLAEQPRVLDLALAHGVRAVLLSFGEVAPFAAAVHAAGARLVVQVQSVAQAWAARDAGADVVVAQGSEAGGHAGQRATLPLVPAVVDAVAPLPVVAAGGIADGRGVAAALMLGAAGVMLGSRFYASAESLAPAGLRAAAMAGRGDDTVRSAVFDRLRGWDWPPGYGLRSLANDLTRDYMADPAAFERALDPARADYARAVAAADPARAAVIVGEAIDLVDDCPPAAVIVERVMAEAVACLDGAAGLLHA